MTRSVGLLSLATFAVHVAAASRMRIPIIQADESGYLGNARYIVQGIGRTHQGYASGYSLLLAPAALLSHDPLTAYHFSLVVNALLAASVPLLGLFLVRRVLPDTPGPALVGTALVLVVYPGWSTLTNLTLSENALVPAVLGAACVIAVAGESLPRWCGAAALASYAAFVNPRGILVVVAFGIACLVATRPWKTLSPGGPALALAFVLTIAGRVANIALAGTSRVPGVSDGFGLAVFRPFVHPTLWGDALANLLGRLVYSSIATFGLVLAGLAVLTVFGIAVARRRAAAPESESIVPVAVFAVPAVLLTLVLGALASAKTSSTAIDYLVYGRYVDAVLAPVLAVGAAGLFGNAGRVARSTAIRRALAVGAALVAAVAVFALVRPATPPGARLNVANVLALRVYLVRIHRSLPVVLLAGVALTTLVLIVVALDRRVGATVMIVFFAWSSWVTYNDYAVRDSVGRSHQHALVDGIDRLRDIGVDASCIVVDDTPKPSGWHVATYKFLEPRSSFESVSPGDTDCGPLVVSADPTANTRYPGARPVTYENFAPLGLWVVMPRVPPPVRDEMLAKGLVGPVPLSAPLPGDAYRSSIRLDAQDLTTSRLRFGVQLRHAGSGAPWAGSFSALQPKRVGPVRMLVSLVGADGTEITTPGCSVPRTMFPGDEVDVDCNVAIAQGAVAPGPYTLRVGLVQQGVAKFSDRGDGVATLPVTLGR